MARLRPVLLLVLATVYAALIVNLDRARALMDGEFEEAALVTPGVWHYAREAALALLFVVLLHGVLRHKRLVAGSVVISPWVVIFAGYVGFLAMRTVMLDYPTEFLAYGLRPVLLVAILAALRHYDRDDANKLLTSIARWCKPLLLIEAGLAVYQVRNSPPFFGETAMGARAWATFAAPNNLGVACLALALLFAVAKPKRWVLWVGLAAAVVSVTGTRTALLGMVALVGVLLFGRVRASALLVPYGLAIGGALLWIFSQESVSGRQIEGEGRLSNWPIIVGDLDWVEWIFGRALGVGTNAAYLADPSMFAVPVSDSQIIAQLLSFGLIGVAFMVCGAAHLWKVGGPRRALSLSVLALAALVFNVAEYYPANVILAVVIGLSAWRCRCPESGGLRVDVARQHVGSARDVRDPVSSREP